MNTNTAEIICTACGGAGELVLHRYRDGDTNTRPCHVCEGTGAGPDAPLTPAEEEAVAHVNPLGHLVEISLGDLTPRHDMAVAGRIVHVTAVEPVTPGTTRVFCTEQDGQTNFVFVGLNTNRVQVAA